MSLIDKGRRLFTTPEEPIKQPQSRDERFFHDLGNRAGRTPPKQTPDSFANRRQEATPQELDDASWGLDQRPPDEFDFTAEDTQQFRADVVELARELQPIPEAPLPIEGEIVNEFEQIATQIERELVEFRADAVGTIRNGLALAAEVRDRGRAHCAEVRRVLEQAAALRLKYQKFSTHPGENQHVEKSQATDSHALGQASGGGGADRAPADAQQPAGEAEQRDRVRELHRDADRGSQGPRLAQRTPEVLPQA